MKAHLPHLERMPAYFPPPMARGVRRLRRLERRAWRVAWRRRGTDPGLPATVREDMAERLRLSSAWVTYARRRRR